MNLLDYPFQYKDLNNGKFLLEINHKYFTVESELVTVLGILKEVDSYDKAVSRYNHLKNENHSAEDFEEYARALVDGLDLEMKEKSFLLWEHSVMSPKRAASISQYLNFLFAPSLFYIVFSLLLVFGLYVLFGVDTPKETKVESFIYIAIGYAFSTLFHELGHIAACRRFTGKNGEIGVGIYIFYPIFYSNISAVWMANTSQRIITNLGGIYLQLILAIVSYVIFFVFGNQFFIEFSKILIIFCLFQILPFIRSDGYWILSDIMNEPNLLKKSNLALWNGIKSLFGFETADVRMNYKLILYSFFNYGVIIYFLYFQISQNSVRLLNFPDYILHQFKDLFTGDFEHISIDWGYFPVIVFYFIIYQYTKRLYKLIKNSLSVKSA